MPRCHARQTPLATAGRGGALSVSVGAGTSGAGGAFSLTGGNSGQHTGGVVTVATGGGAVTTSGAIVVKTVKGQEFGYALAEDTKGGQVILAPTFAESKPRFYREFLQTLDDFQTYTIGNNLNVAYKHCLSLRLWEKAQSQAKQKAIR